MSAFKLQKVLANCFGFLVGRRFFDTASTKREDKLQVMFEREEMHHKILRRQDKTFNESKPMIF